MFWIPLLAVVLTAAETVYDKLFLRASRMSLQEFLIDTGVWLGILLVPFVFFTGSVDLAQALSFKGVVLVTLMVAFSIGINLTLFSGLRQENLVRFELAGLLQPVAAIALAAVFLPAERDPRVWLVAAISVAALLFAHWRRNHISFEKGERLLLLSVILFGIHSVILRFLLDIYSPSALFFVRIVIQTILFMLMFGFSWREFVGQRVLKVFVSSAIALGSILLTYFSLQIYGVTVTSLVGLLYPVLVYFTAVEFLGVKEPWKMGVASVIIIASIAYLFMFM